MAASNDQLFGICNQNPDSTICQSRNTTTNPVTHTIKAASDIVALLAGIAAVIVIIAGGISLITSAGNAESVANARKNITYAIIGLVVVALAWVIVAFVIDKLVK
jgi:glucose uptake protein GlcU